MENRREKYGGKLVFVVI